MRSARCSDSGGGSSSDPPPHPDGTHGPGRNPLDLDKTPWDPDGNTPVPDPDGTPRPPGQTNTPEIITFPQLRLREAKIYSKEENTF